MSWIYQIEYGYPELFFRPYGEPAPCHAERCERSLYRPQFQQRASAFYSEIQAGQVLPETAVSGYCTFQKVAFDLKKLAEYDPQGTREFMESHGIQIADATQSRNQRTNHREKGRKQHGSEK